MNLIKTKNELSKNELVQKFELLLSLNFYNLI